MLRNLGSKIFCLSLTQESSIRFLIWGITNQSIQFLFHDLFLYTVAFKGKQS